MNFLSVGGLPRLSARAARNRRRSARADSGLVPDAQSLALAPLAARRRPTGPLHAASDHDARASLALVSAQCRARAPVLRDLQVVSRSRRRPLLHRVSLCRTQRPACPAGETSPGLVLGESGNIPPSSSRRRKPFPGNVARAQAARLDDLRQPTADRSGSRGDSGGDRARPALWQSAVAKTHCLAPGTGIDVPPARPTKKEVILGTQWGTNWTYPVFFLAESERTRHAA